MITPTLFFIIILITRRTFERSVANRPAATFAVSPSQIAIKRRSQPLGTERAKADYSHWHLDYSRHRQILTPSMRNMQTGCGVSSDARSL